MLKPALFILSLLLTATSYASDCNIATADGTEARALQSYKNLVHYVIRPTVYYSDGTWTGFDLSADSLSGDATVLIQANQKIAFLEKTFPIVMEYKRKCIGI